MIGFAALLLSALVAWLTHALIGTHVSAFADFAAGTVTGGTAYVLTFYWLKKFRGDF